MIAYLNGLSEIGRSKGKGKAKKALSKIKKTSKILNEKRRALDKKIIAKHKELAKKVGAGVKRIAKIKKDVAVKAALLALEKNLLGLSTRLKVAYRVDPAAVKGLLSQFGTWEKFSAAINKGASSSAAISKYLGEDEAEAAGSDQTAQYAEAAKASVGIIQKIVEFFKKRKESKKGDSETVEAMANSVDADTTIPKVDENGKDLPTDPAVEKIDAIDKGTADTTDTGSSLMDNKGLLIGGALALAVGGYFLLKKK